MRHPNGAGPYEAAAEQVNHMRMAGWLTAEEWQAAGLPEPFAPEPPEPEQTGQTDEAAQAAAQDTKPSRRPRTRPSSEGNDS